MNSPITANPTSTRPIAQWSSSGWCCCFRSCADRRGVFVYRAGGDGERRNRISSKSADRHRSSRPCVHQSGTVFLHATAFARTSRRRAKCKARSNRTRHRLRPLRIDLANGHGSHHRFRLPVLLSLVRPRHPRHLPPLPRRKYLLDASFSQNREA